VPDEWHSLVFDIFRMADGEWLARVGMEAQLCTTVQDSDSNTISVNSLAGDERTIM
jgi:hypothetical protein